MAIKILLGTTGLEKQYGSLKNLEESCPYKLFTVFRTVLEGDKYIFALKTITEKWILLTTFLS